ncbi:MAG: PspA-associated protein PspAB [Nocardioides sp.]
MGLWDALRGRRQVTRPDLDSLFLVPSAAITLQTALDLHPTGVGSVCFRAATGAAFADTQRDVVDLLNEDPDAPDVETTTDDFGFTWLTARRTPDDLAGLCTDLHAVNTALEEQGFGDGLLCSLVGFTGTDGRGTGLVYLYKRGTFYPFAPSGPQQRDNLRELQVRDALAAELPLEQDLQRWLAIWGAPGV